MKLAGIILAAVVIAGLVFVLIAAFIVGGRADEMAEAHGDVPRVPE